MCTFLEPSVSSQYPVENYMFKVNDRNTRTRCEICSKLTIKTSETRHLASFWCYSYKKKQNKKNKLIRYVK